MAEYHPSEFLKADGTFRATTVVEDAPIAYRTDDDRWLCAACASDPVVQEHVVAGDALLTGRMLVCDVCDVCLFPLRETE